MDNFDDVRAALAKATPGEWRTCPVDHDGKPCCCRMVSRSPDGLSLFTWLGSEDFSIEHVTVMCPSLEEGKANGDFAALAHNRLPALLAALDAANARLAEAEKERDAMRHELIQTLDDAADDLRSWGAYASDYFQEKHNLRRDIARYTDRHAAMKESPDAQ